MAPLSATPAPASQPPPASMAPPPPQHHQPPSPYGQHPAPAPGAQPSRMRLGLVTSETPVEQQPAPAPAPGAQPMPNRMRLSLVTSDTPGEQQQQHHHHAPPPMLYAPPPQGAAPGGNVLGMGELMRKKRGRPRKYAPDGSMALALAPISSAAGGAAPPGQQPQHGFSISSPPSDPNAKRRGRPPGSGKKKQFEALGTRSLLPPFPPPLSFLRAPSLG